MAHIMIVEAPYYKDISELLLQGACETLSDSRCTYEVFQVPGALEIPLAIKMGILKPEGHGPEHRQFDGFIALGCVIRGETSHYDIVTNESAHGLTKLSLLYSKPIGNGILTCDTKEQALARANPSQKDKGGEAAKAVLSLVELRKKMGIPV